MVAVPAGEFWMGCNEKVDQECDEDEKPGRPVFVDAFKIDRTEVTVAAYRKCVEAGRCSSDLLDANPRSCNGNTAERGNHPLNCVDWEQATTYCAWVGKRLPTEPEWEKAARGTDGRIYPWGNHWEAGKGQVNSLGTREVSADPSGASPYGAVDMSGNVGEWTAGWYDSRHRAIRGGGWTYGPRSARVSDRNLAVLGPHSVDVGFRCVQ
jgi:formylglycine-generating enzyme required for sulfatase activity